MRWPVAHIENARLTNELQDAARFFRFAVALEVLNEKMAEKEV
jgi:hypothetical protein